MIRSLDEYVIPHPLTICVVEAKPDHTMIPLVCLHGFLVHWMKSLFLTYWQSVLSKRSLFSSYVFFFFFGFSVRKFVILLMLNGVFFPPPNFVLSKVWRFLFLIAIKFFFFPFNLFFWSSDLWSLLCWLQTVISYYALLQCTKLMWQFTSIDPNINPKKIFIETYECSGNGEKRNHKGFWMIKK